MKIPNKIKVGGIDYEIEMVDYKENDFAEIKIWGKTERDKCKIVLYNGVNPQRLWETLFHEIIHIIDRHFDINLNESKVERLSNGIYQVLKDNKLLKE